MVEKILEELRKKIEADKAKGYKASGSVDMEMPKDVFGNYDGEFTDGLIIYYPSMYRHSKQYSVLEDTADLHLKFDTLQEVAKWICSIYYSEGGNDEEANRRTA